MARFTVFAHDISDRYGRPQAGAETRKTMTLSEFCAEADRIGLTPETLATELAARPEFADCLPEDGGHCHPGAAEVSQSNVSGFGSDTCERAILIQDIDRGAPAAIERKKP